MMGLPRLWKLLPTTALGSVAFTLSTQSAVAFFPPVPLGSEPISVLPPAPAPVIVPINPTVEVPPSQGPLINQPNIPLVPPPPFSPPNIPTEGPPPCTCPPNIPSTVPEPTTLVTGLIGAGLVSVWGLRRTASKKSSNS